MGLSVSTGSASQTGHRKANEDAFAIAIPEQAELAAKGLTFAIADGVGGSDNGGAAARYTAHGVVADYYATPDTWEISAALDKVIVAQNRWLRAQREGGHGSLATTLSLLVLRGRRYCIAHVGDTRIYRCREGRLECLTQDHVWDQRGMEHVLTRAMGLDQGILVDYSDGELVEGDRFILLSDGVWASLTDVKMHGMLGQSCSKTLAEGLVDAALAAGSQDNVTAVVVDVQTLPSVALSDTLALSHGLPLPPRLRAGQTLDGFTVDSLLHVSRNSLVYRVQDARGQRWVLKTLPPEAAGDALLEEALLLEEWLGRRVSAPGFPRICPLGPIERQHLYYLASWHDGQTLAAALAEGRRFAVAEVVQLGLELAAGLSALHRLNIFHRDIKLENLHLGQDQRLRILDLGVAWCPGIRIRSLQDNPGTPSYMAPELFQDGEASLATEVYAAGVALYHLLTRRYPYGEIEPFTHPRFGDPVPPSRYRPDMPLWLDQLLLKAVAREPRQRIETADELRLLLARGDSFLGPRVGRSPLAQRNPLAIWQLLALTSLVLNLLLFYVLSVS